MTISLTSNATEVDSCPWNPNFVSRASKLVTPAAIQAIPKSSNVREIISRLGPAARDVGSGVYLLQWDMSDGRIFAITAVSACKVPMASGVTTRKRDPQGEERK